MNKFWKLMKNVIIKATFCLIAIFVVTISGCSSNSNISDKIGGKNLEFVSHDNVNKNSNDSVSTDTNDNNSSESDSPNDDNWSTTSKDLDELKYRVLTIKEKYKQEIVDYSVIVALPNLNLEKKSYNPPSDEDLSKEATEKFLPIHQINENLINDKYNKTISELDTKIKDCNDAYDHDHKKAVEHFEQMEKNKQAELYKRGLRDSSTWQYEMKRINDERTASLASLQTEHENTKSKLNNKITEAGKSRDLDLEQLNVTYNKDITTEFNKLKNARDKEIKEVEKHNNKVDSDIIAHAKKNADHIRAEKSRLDKELVIKNEQNEQKMQSGITREIKKYLENMTALDAKNLMIDDKFFIENLSSKDYAKLLNQMILKSSK